MAAAVAGRTTSGSSSASPRPSGLGAGSAWVSEHHGFEDGYSPQPLTFAAAIAARTSRVRIGTAIMLGPLRPALDTAEQAAIVDILSDGRVDLGLGTGYRASEYRAFEREIEGRYPKLEATVREIRRVWERGHLHAAARPGPSADLDRGDRPSRRAHGRAARRGPPVALLGPARALHEGPRGGRARPLERAHGRPRQPDPGRRPGGGLAADRPAPGLPARVVQPLRRRGGPLARDPGRERGARRPRDAAPRPARGAAARPRRRDRRRMRSSASRAGSDRCPLPTCTSGTASRACPTTSPSAMSSWWRAGSRPRSPGSA